MRFTLAPANKIHQLAIDYENGGDVKQIAKELKEIAREIHPKKTCTVEKKNYRGRPYLCGNQHYAREMSRSCYFKKRYKAPPWSHSGRGDNPF